jgi:hypothetical protein
MKMRKTVQLLLCGLVWTGQLTGNGQGHVGRSVPGSQRGRAPGAAVRIGGPRFGHHFNNWRGLQFGRTYPRAGYRPGFYFPFYFPGYYGYGLDTYVISIPPADSSLPDFAGEEQPYYQQTPVPNQNVDCRDTWTKNHEPTSLSGAMTRILQIQCENGHADTASQPENSKDTD